MGNYPVPALVTEAIDQERWLALVSNVFCKTEDDKYLNGDYAPHYPVPSPYVESEIVGTLWPWDYCTGLDTWPSE